MVKKLKTMQGLMREAVPTTAEPTRQKRTAREVEQQQLVVQLPKETIHALKLQALTNNTSVRAVLLEALHVAGFPVPEGQAVDFRKVRQ
jgi:hypothetical protein